MKKFIKNIFVLSIPQGVSLAITLVTFPIILASLRPEDYGLFQFVLAIQVWLNALSAEYSITGSQRGLARGNNGTFIYALFYRLKFIIPIGILTLISSGFFYFFGRVEFSIILFLMGLYFMLGYLPQVSYNSVFIAKKQFKSFSFWKSIDSIMIPIGSAIVAYSTGSILMYALVHFGATSLVGWSGLIYAVKKNNLLEEYKNKNIDKSVSEYGLKMIPSAFTLQGANKIIDFVIGPFFGFANLALYAVANSLETRSRSLIKVVQLLIYPEFAKKNWLDLKKTITTKLLKTFFISWVFVIGFSLLGYLYISLFLPDFYSVSAIYLIILLLGFPAKVLRSILQTAFDSALRHKEMSYLIIIPNIIKIIIVVVLGLSFGIYGMLWGLSVFAWLHFFFTYFLFKYKT